MIAHGPMMITQVAAHPIVYCHRRVRADSVDHAPARHQCLRTPGEAPGNGHPQSRRERVSAASLRLDGHDLVCGMFRRARAIAGCRSGLGTGILRCDWYRHGDLLLHGRLSGRGHDGCDPSSHDGRGGDRYTRRHHHIVSAASMPGGRPTWPTHWQTPSWGFDPSMRVSFGMLLLSTTLWYVCTNGSDQMSIQRFLSTRDAKAARRTLSVAQITDATMAILLALTGVAILGYYQATTAFDPRTDPAARRQVLPEVHHERNACRPGRPGGCRDSRRGVEQCVFRPELMLRRTRTRFPRRSFRRACHAELAAQPVARLKRHDLAVRHVRGRAGRS